MKKITGFTLAEVLITLTIIGVIAVLTIPNLMKKWEDQHTVSAVKEAYSIFDNAFKLAVRENGDVYSWFSKANNNASRTDAIAKNLMPYLKVSKYCGSHRNCKDDICNACISYQRQTGGFSYVSNLNGYNSIYMDNNNYSAGRMLLANGMTASFGLWNYTLAREKDHVAYGFVSVDVNGKKGPNRVGYDIFSFHFDDEGLVSKPSKSYFFQTYKQRCSKSQNDTSNDIGRANGSMCSIWILMKNNVDYKYRNVSAEW